MDTKKVSEKWQGLSEEMNAGIVKWHAAHPMNPLAPAQPHFPLLFEKLLLQPLVLGAQTF